MNLNIVSKHRAVIYGAAIFWIVVFHASAINSVDYSFGMKQLLYVKKFINVGNVGVDMFLFLSGVSLYFSFVRKPDVAAFIRKRLLRIVPAVWVVNTIYWAWKYLFLAFEPGKFVTRMLLVQFWITGDSSIWFVSLILVLYFAYPYIYYFLFNNPRGSLVRCLLLMLAVYVVVYRLSVTNTDLYKMIEIALTRIPAFIFGCYMGKPIYEGKMVPKVVAPALVLAAIGFFAVVWFTDMHGCWKRYFMLVGGVSISYVLALVCCGIDRLADTKKRPLYRFFAWLGGFSLELYLSHIMLNQVMRMMPWYVKGNLVQYAVMAALAILLAWATAKIVSLLIARLNARKAAVQKPETA